MSANFDPNNPRYKTCCKCCHVKTCSIVIGVLEAVWAGGIMIQALTGQDSGRKGGGGTIFAFCVVALVFLFLGIAKEKAVYLIPHLVYQGLVMVASLVLGILFAIGAHYSKRDADYLRSLNSRELGGEYDKAFILLIAMSIACFINIIIEAWFAYVIYKCYLYFKEKGQMVMYSAPPIQMVPAQAPNTYKAGSAA